MRVLPFMALLLLTACTLAEQQGTSAPTSVPGEPSLTVAWMQNGDLYVWQQASGETRRTTSGGVVRPYVAPDGRHIAFTRGPQGIAESLWVVDADGTAEQQIANHDNIHYSGSGRVLIGQVAWLDNQVLLFNTLEQTETSITARDDLYRVDVQTRETALLLVPGEGGAFSISPDRQHIATVYPGTYGTQDAVIRITDPLARATDELLFFVGVSTGASYKFYPELYWTPDSSAVLVAIPDADLIYDESAAPPTTLWRLPIATPSARDIIGTLQTSFFGLPRWSSNGEQMVYLRRAEGATDNTFELYVAAGDGTNPVLYASGEIGTLEPARWLHATETFTYVQNGVLWLGSANNPPQRLPNADELVISVMFTESPLYVFTSFGQNGAELRYARLDDRASPSLLIAAVSDAALVFDGVVSDE
jgi:hypothetical protein